MKIFSFCLFALFVNVSFAQQNYLIVGTYDSPKSEGIYVYRFDSQDGTATEVNHIKTVSPSFLTISKDEKFVYAVSETSVKDGKPGEVISFAFDKKTGQLNLLNKQASGGDHPCHVELDKTGKWLFVSNYTGGTISCLPVNDDGMLGVASVIQHNGSGPNVERQKTAHVHGAIISADNKTLYVTDLGTDKLMLYNFDELTGKLSPSEPASIASTPAAGPRLFTQGYRSKYAYVIEELTGTIQVYKNDGNKVNPIHRYSTMPEGDLQFAGSADIHISPDLKFLYASNRAESNTIAIFKIKKNGKLKLIAHQSTLGKTPRNFSIDPSGNFLLVGNQNSDEIVVFKRNKKTGLLTDAGQRISLGKPVCLKWVSIESPIPPTLR